LSFDITRQRVELSTKTFLEILAILAFLALAYTIRDILLLLFIAVILMSAGNPLVDKFEKAKLPRWVGTLFLYLATILFLALVFAIIIPPFVAQTNEFILRLPSFTDKAVVSFGLERFINIVDLHLLTQNLLKDFSRDLAQTPIHLVRFGAGVVGKFFKIITVAVFTFYLLVEHRKVKKVICAFFSKNKSQEIKVLIENVESKLGSWLRGQVVLSFIVGLLVFLGLIILRINFALPLALLAGLLEIIPMFGPIISLLPAFIVALAVSPIKAAAVLLLYIFVQQVGSNFIAPQVMKEAVGLDPLAVILALMIGARLAGPVGAVLAVPVTAVLLILASNKRINTSQSLTPKI